MTLTSDFAPNPTQAEVLAEVEPQVEKLMQRHLDTRKLWFPNDFLPADEVMTQAQEDDLKSLPERARGMPDPVRVSLALNLLTEEGLPHFHRLVAVYMGADNAWQRWNYMWTAEEDRHGIALHDYVRGARLFDMGAFEKLQYQYLESGFNPVWNGDPYKLLAYTSLQERATQAAHAATARVAGRHEPLLQTIISRISGDESRHYRFYRDAFKAVLEIDPTRALQAALEIAPNLAMPGHSIAGYMEMADVVRRAGLYGPQDYRKIVIELLEYWDIEHIEPPDAAGREARDKLLAIPKRLQRLADLLEKRTNPKTFSFDIVYNRSFELMLDGREGATG
jgi:acyl-[acyl-carrier-protein] desaturase